MSDNMKSTKFPLSKTEYGIYVEFVNDPQSTAYNLPIFLNLNPSTDICKLKKSVAQALENHSYLKTRLFKDKDGSVCKSCDGEAVQIVIKEISDKDFNKSNFIYPFDLLNDALSRISIIKLESSVVLFFDIHHIIFDRYSLGIFLEDIDRAFNGLPLARENYTANDVSADEAERLLSSEFAEAKKYYTSVFDGIEIDSAPINDLRENAQSAKKIRYDFNTFNADTIRKFTRNLGIKTSAFFDAVFGFLLAKFSGAEESLFSTVFNGRSDKLTRTCGMFVKTLPLYCNTKKDDEISEYLHKTDSQIENSRKHSLYSYSDICSELHINPQVIFAYQGDVLNSMSFCGSDVTVEFEPSSDAKEKITLEIYRLNGRFYAELEYRADLYKESSMNILLVSFEKAINEFLTKDKLSEINITDDNMLCLLDSFNETEVDYEKTDVVTLFRRQAEQNPENKAVVYNDKSYTYREVDEISEKLGAYLISLGIGREDVVSVLIPRCEYMLIASLGILKSGAAYQPLDPSYPQERLEFMISDAAAKLLITNRDLLALVPNYNGNVLFIEDIADLAYCAKIGENPKPQDLFIMLYTSGSTGVPKGCMLEHRNIVSFCNWFNKFYGVNSKSRIAAYASYGFDANMMDMYPAITKGACVYIIDESIRLDLVAIDKYFKENKITHSFMTTQVGRQFATEIDNEALVELSVGGERLVPLDPPKNHKMFNIYGPTETTVCITAFELDKFYDRIPIGKALDNTKLYVTDKYGRRLPPCVPGELWVAGHGVSRGYLNRPEQNEKAFINNPFTSESGYERVYKTGDIVRFLPDGNIDFVGRNDGQVKIRGFRIELSEVERIIREFNGIKDATVAAFDEPTGGKFIAAYIVSDETVDIQKLNEFILENKPPYMVPAVTMQIDKIPLNQNQKVNKRALPKPERKSENKDASSRPMTVLEKKIHGIIAEILGSDKFSVTENLMFSGLNSLSVIKLAVELHREFGYDTAVKELMKGFSVISIENEIQEYFLSGALNHNNSRDMEKKEYKSFYPLSKTQLGVYADCMKNPNSILYNIPAMLVFPKSINAQRLAESVKKVILAHPYVLTRLTTQNDDIQQIFAQTQGVEIPVKVISEAEFSDLKNNFVKPYELIGSQLFRICIAETENNVYLLSDFHHLIFDGGSLNIFMQQIKDAYEGRNVEAETYAYYDYVDYEINTEGSEEYNKAEKFFENMLKNFESPSEITPDLSKSIDNGKLAEVEAPIDLSKFEKFCTDNGFTLAQLFLAGTFYAVSRFVNGRNVYISTISNGRSDMRLSNSFGMFVKTLALGIEVEDISSYDFVSKAKNVFSQAIENEIYPYAKLCSKFGYSPNIVYEYQLGVTDELTVDNESVTKEYLTIEKPKFKTSIHIESRNNTPCVVVQYNDALYSKGLMQTLAESVLNAVTNIVENPNGRIRKVSLLNDKQTEKILGFSSTEMKPINVEVLHKLFENQASKTPDRKALVACDRALTYSELDRLANITANELIARGLKKGGRVLILLSRTSRVFTTILGVLKAGGVFIPSCPDYPKERIDSIIEDSEVDFVVTEGELLGVYDKTVDVLSLEAGSNYENPNIDVAPSDLAYMIYTSGSTGKPKGVMLRHKGISNYVTYSDSNTQVKAVVDKCHSYGSVTTIAFDMSLKETILSLCNGLTLVFANDEQTLNPISLTEFLKENSIDAFNSTPSRLLQYMELDGFAEVMSNCKVILSGGEKYPYELLKLLRAKTKAQILNTYGPTEITVSSNCKDLTNAEEISVGKPLMNYIEHIVDCDNNLLPAGVVGELLISGCGVALGYNKLAEQTEKAFIEFNGERTYRSGDYAKWTDNGDVIILGRNDNQVKLRGLRIELGEIEKCLSSVKGVKSSVVIIKKVNNADAVCAYFTADTKLDVEYLKNELKKSLTDYMVPSAYVQLPKMPLTPNGKINTKLLPEPVMADNKIGKAASSNLEKTICDIFAEVLELDNVYADDNFFDIGGSSLTVTRVIILANKKGIDIAYGDVFENPTPMSLAKLYKNDEVKNDFEDLSNYDYSSIENLLNKNNINSFKNGEMQKIGDVLLTGAAGFLGIHILYELLHKYDGKVYCLLRDKNSNSAKDRLNMMFYYYFEESLNEKYADRITILSGDVTDRKSFDKFLQFNIDAVINCAANVKHFSKGTDIEDVNLYGALNVIDFCKQANARLIHISTMSVGGVYVGDTNKITHLKENLLYFGQQTTSKYTSSKFLAERAVLEECTKGFNAKIMRVGTLAPRNSDGEYQINFTTNTFMGRLKSNIIIGKYPYDVIEMPFELSPIEFVAKSILLLSQTPKDCTVFHPFNNHMLMMGDLYMEMDKEGLHSQASEAEEYDKALEEAKQNPEKAKILSSMLAYQNMAHGKKVFTVGKSNEYTMQALYRMGFRWPVTSLDYMKRFITALRGLGFFDFAE